MINNSLYGDKPNEECAVFGVSLKTKEAAGIVYNGLLALQHRGQEGAGIAAADGNNIVCLKNTGLVSEALSGKLSKLPKTSVAIGHARYSTTGRGAKENTGPFVTEYLTGRIATAHNGNVTNALDLRDGLRDFGLNFGATTDSEVASALIAYYIRKEKNAVSGVKRAAGLLHGAFSLLVLSGKGKLIAVRDPDGYRPLCIGKNDNGYAVSSESCALDSCGFEFLRDINPGEIVVIENGRITYEKTALRYKNPNGGLCIFEYVYFARPDSVIDGLSVYEARYNTGKILAEEHPVQADIVCGVPDSGLEAASGYAEKSGIRLAAGFIKNRYIGRSFIYPDQTQRDSAVTLKLNPLSAVIKGKRIILIDDSIVRGTTSEKIVKSLKNAGAKEVHLRISSPPFKHVCEYGTDIDNEENLIANKFEINAICRRIGADSLGYISIEGLKRACGKCVLPFCTGCFTGNGKSAGANKNKLED